MVRVVFDTVGLVRGLINPTSRWGRILFEYTDAYVLVVSREIVAEALDVMERPQLVRRFSTLPGRDPDAVREVLTRADNVTLQTIPPISRDPKDDKFLATALAGNADYLVTEDQDLLVLGEYEEIPIITALAFLRLLNEDEADT